ncbi:MAG: hypothetical protein ACLS55_12775 [Lachnospiraceae bacterium]
MRKFKKVLASILAGTLVLSNAVPVLAAQDSSSLPDGTAYLNINNSEWSEFDAEWVNAEITGDGSYTVSMTAAEAQDLSQFNALEVVNGESVLGTGAVITVDSIELNGEKIELQGSSYTCSADGSGVTTRVNLYNEWNAPDATATAGDDKHADCRVAEGNVADATACLWTADQLTGVTSIVVNFTVSGFGTAGGPAEAADTSDAATEAVAHLNINNESWGEYEAEYVDATITGDGTYTVSMNAAEPQDLAQFNALQVPNGEALLGTACVLTVDSIKINGEEITLQGPSYTCSADGAGVDTRVNLYNEWNAPDNTATAGDDSHLDQRIAGGDLMGATACLWTADQLAGVQSVEVTFTVSDFGKNAEAGEVTGNGEFDANGEFNVYIGVQTAAYSFRNAWNDSYGLGTPEFDQITGWNGNDEVVRTGTISDAVIKGNGTYTVSLTGVDFADDAETLNLLFLSTDIPLDKGVELTDIKVKMGGKSVYDFDTAFQDPDTKDYIKALLINTYNDGFKADNEFAYTLSAGMDIEVTFTVSGLAYDNPDAAASGDTAATEATSQSTETKSEAPETTAANANAEASNGGVSVGVIIAIVAAVVVVAAIVVVAVKKKK